MTSVRRSSCDEAGCVYWDCVAECIGVWGRAERVVSRETGSVRQFVATISMGRSADGFTRSTALGLCARQIRGRSPLARRAPDALDETPRASSNAGPGGPRPTTDTDGTRRAGSRACLLVSLAVRSPLDGLPPPRCWGLHDLLPGLPRARTRPVGPHGTARRDASRLRPPYGSRTLVVDRSGSRHRRRDLALHMVKRNRTLAESVRPRSPAERPRARRQRQGRAHRQPVARPGMRAGWGRQGSARTDTAITRAGSLRPNPPALGARQGGMNRRSG